LFFIVPSHAITTFLSYYQSVIAYLVPSVSSNTHSNEKTFFNSLLAPYHGLVGMNIGMGKSEFIARCLMSPRPNASYPMISFDKWQKAIIINDHNGISYTREQLIVAVAEQDGGIKVASGLDPSYIELARKRGVGWRIGRPGAQERPLLGVELHSIHM